ncbi:YdeI/OmpD-associated family protein [Aestuariibaculum sediminum]|uniref:YdeI/OmpD-associated family protein n=1 Tax=Aestuariibaculum sediminum TaxID=2770637 RepID=A0A8J6Q5E7_9FLAO|nr:DUF1801 domain-containing protein [Aestuariibaculum sediminum]MBD0830613.1 YdeI/OmpD-associated family protein [Aestuariibaculum sediminum]
MTSNVETYFNEGCNRCSLGGTHGCKVHNWIEILQALRHIILECGLTETCKWGVPCYTYNNNNVIMLSAYKNFCCISFFKGALLSNDRDLLVAPGANSQAARLLKFTKIDQVKQLKQSIKSYIYEAIEIEKQGLKVSFKTQPEPLPGELLEIFETDPLLKSAFEALTPGRQRGYILYFSAPKQSKTRVSRIEKCTQNILHGIGLHDNYKAKKR